MKNLFPETQRLCDEILTTCAVTNLRKLTRLTTNQFNERIKSTGMRTTQICVLLAIGRERARPLTAYAEELCMDLSTLARSIETLEKGGFVALRSGKRRERLAILTEAGEKKIAEVYPLWQAAQAEFIAAFGSERWQTYLSAAAGSIA